MKRWMLIVFWGFTIALYSQQSKKFNWKPVEGGKIKYNRFLYKHQPTFNKFSIPYSEFKLRSDTIGYLKLSSGTEIKIPPFAFKTPDGVPFFGDYTVYYREFYTTDQIISSGIPMQFGEKQNLQNLKSAGMFQIDVKSGNQQLFLKQDITIQVNLATYDTTQYNKFYYQPNKSTDSWVLLSTAPISYNTSKTHELEKIQNQLPHDNFFKLKFDTINYPELSDLCFQYWEYAGNIEDSLSPKKQNWILDEKWNSVKLYKVIDFRSRFSKIEIPAGQFWSRRILPFSDKRKLLAYSSRTEKSSDQNLIYSDENRVWISKEKLRVESIDFSESTNNIVASSYESLMLWNLQGGSQSKVLSSSKSMNYSPKGAVKFDDKANTIKAITLAGTLETYSVELGQLTNTKRITQNKFNRVIESPNKEWFALLNTGQIYDTPIGIEFFDWSGMLLGKDTISNVSQLQLSTTPGKYAVIDNKSLQILIKLNGSVLFKIPLPKNVSNAISLNEYHFKRLNSYSSDFFQVDCYNKGSILFDWNGLKIRESKKTIVSYSDDLKYIATSEFAEDANWFNVSKLPLDKNQICILNTETNVEYKIPIEQFSVQFKQNSHELWVQHGAEIYFLNLDSLPSRENTLYISNDSTEYKTKVYVDTSISLKVKNAMKRRETEILKQKLESIKLQADFQRQFFINNLGIYNVDKIVGFNNSSTKRIRFYSGDKPIKQSFIMYHITGENSDIVIKEEDARSITYNPSHPNHLILIIGNRMALIYESEFSKYCTVDDDLISLPINLMEQPNTQEEFSNLISSFRRK